MDLEESLDFLREINTKENRLVHIVDMDTYEAYSSFYPKGQEKIGIYQSFKEKSTVNDISLSDVMQRMFKGVHSHFELLGQYRLTETQSMAISVGKKVTIRTPDDHKDYLMLRVIPVDKIKETWVFPTDYKSAEVGIITRGGSYVIQSKSMRSQSLPEYIRAHNYQRDYKRSQEFRETLMRSNSGTFEATDFRGNDCLWYYSSFGSDAAIDMVGLINEDEIKASMDSWYIIFIICGALLVMMIMDGVYLLKINMRLREATAVAERSNRAKTQFLSAMSHDIRTPINAVIGLMEIVQKKPDDPEHVVECMNKGLQSGRHLSSLINDVLDISKIESGEVALNRDTVDLVELADELVEMQKASVSEKHIELITDMKSLSSRYVLSDRTRLSQVY